MPNKVLSWTVITFIILLIYPLPNNNGCLDENNELPYKIYNDDISAQIFDTVSEESFKNFVRKFTENGSRWTQNNQQIEFSNANIHARYWISKQLVELSNNRIQIEIMGDHKSIIGILPGWIPYDAPCIMIGAHYDSVPGAPGANDDGTGIATILELVRVMANYSWPLDVYFCAWNSEEIGLLGSAEVASVFRNEGLDILVYYNIDMLLVDDDEAPEDERVLMIYNSGPHLNYQTSHLFADITRMMSNNIGLNLIKPEPSLKFPYWSQSDHVSFLHEGYHNVLFAFESGSHLDDAYHSPSDVWDNPLYNYSIARETVASIGASMAFIMARAYGEPTKLNYSGSLEVNVARRFYAAVSTRTNIIVSSKGEDAELSFTLSAPNGTIIDFSQGINTIEACVFNHSVENLGLYSLLIHNRDTRSIQYDIEICYESDIDGNNISDSLQFWFEPEMFERDIDGDGLVDGHEVILGTVAWLVDTDSDEIPDGWEYENGLDPLINDASLDPDNDNLSNLLEFQSGTNPFNNDTDDDSIPDNWEVENGLDPLVDDASEDPDLDGISNLEEYRANLNPHVSNSNQMILLITGMLSFISLVVAGYALVRKKIMNSNKQC